MTDTGRTFFGGMSPTLNPNLDDYAAAYITGGGTIPIANADFPYGFADVVGGAVTADPVPDWITWDDTAKKFIFTEPALYFVQAYARFEGDGTNLQRRIRSYTGYCIGYGLAEPPSAYAKVDTFFPAITGQQCYPLAFSEDTSDVVHSLSIAVYRVNVGGA